MDKKKLTKKLGENRQIQIALKKNERKKGIVKPAVIMT